MNQPNHHCFVPLLVAVGAACTALQVCDHAFAHQKDASRQSLTLPAAVTNSASWKEWRRTKAGRLVAIAQAQRRLEDEEYKTYNDIVKRLVASNRLSADYQEGSDSRPDRMQSTATLTEALRLNPENLTARCLLAENLIDRAYLGEGDWDAKVINDRLLPHLKTISAQVQRGQLSAVQRRTVRSLYERMEEAFGGGENPALKSFFTWWHANKSRLRIK